MATGMTNTATNNKAVLRAGEQLASTPQALKDPNAKVFRHMIPGARFVMPDGLEIIFLGGQFSTADADVIAELSKVANKPTSMIYTEKAAAEAAIAQQKQAAADAAESAGKAVE